MTLNDVMKIIYNSSAFEKKGGTHELKDAFLLLRDQHPYLVFLTAMGNFERTNLRYHYTVYDVQSQSTAAQDSDLFKAVTSSMPSLETLSSLGGKPAFSKKRMLSEQFEKLAVSFLENGGLTEPEAEQYQDYLREMQELKPPSFAAVYSYFADQFRR